LEYIRDYSFRYGLLEEVTIKEHLKKGIVLQINITELGISYMVRFYDGSDMKSFWFYDFEIL